MLLVRMFPVWSNNSDYFFLFLFIFVINLNQLALLSYLDVVIASLLQPNAQAWLGNNGALSLIVIHSHDHIRCKKNPSYKA